MDQITASEALYDFMGWLTTRQEVLSVGASHECAPVADVVKEFCAANNLAEPRDGWEKNFVHPENERESAITKIGALQNRREAVLELLEASQETVNATVGSHGCDMCGQKTRGEHTDWCEIPRLMAAITKVADGVQ